MKTAMNQRREDFREIMKSANRQSNHTHEGSK
jgi:hypothetical protein